MQILPVEKRNVVILGAGSIGSAIERQVRAARDSVAAVVTGHELRTEEQTISFAQPGNSDEVLKDLQPICDEGRVNLIFNAMPSGGDGITDMRYLLFASSAAPDGIALVTAAKGAFANQYAAILPHLGKVSRETIVGGSLRALALAKMFIDPKSFLYAEGCFNGTFGSIFSDLFVRCPLQMAVDNARRGRYVDPLPDGSTPEPFAVFLGELLDWLRKIAAFVNDVDALRAFAGRIITMSELHMVPFTEDYMREVTKTGARRIYMVRIGIDGERFRGVERGSPGYLRAEFGRLVIEAGFYRIPEGSTYERYIQLGGPWNSLRLFHQGDNRLLPHTFHAFGAGVDATVPTMMKGADDVCPKQG